MKYLSFINWLQITYIFAMLGFISFYYFELRPIKIQRYCQKLVAQEILFDPQNPDPYSSYQQSFKSCLADKSLGFLL